MPGLLYTADWQIGRQYSRFAEEDALILADARFTAIKGVAPIEHYSVQNFESSL